MIQFKVWHRLVDKMEAAMIPLLHNDRESMALQSVM